MGHPSSKLTHALKQQSTWLLKRWLDRPFPTNLVLMYMCLHQFVSIILLQNNPKICVSNYQFLCIGEAGIRRCSMDIEVTARPSRLPMESLLLGPGILLCRNV